MAQMKTNNFNVADIYICGSVVLISWFPSTRWCKRHAGSDSFKYLSYQGFALWKQKSTSMTWKIGCLKGHMQSHYSQSIECTEVEGISNDLLQICTYCIWKTTAWIWWLNVWSLKYWMLSNTSLLICFTILYLPRLYNSFLCFTTLCFITLFFF